MSANSSADTTRFNRSSYPFPDGCPDRHRHPVPVISFKTLNVREQSGVFNPMDELSLNYSYLSLNDLPFIVPDPQFSAEVNT